MTNIRKESILIGILIVLSFVFGILSIESYIDSDSYLREIALNAVSVKISLFAQFALSCLYIVISLYLKLNKAIFGNNTVFLFFLHVLHFSSFPLHIFPRDKKN